MDTRTLVTVAVTIIVLAAGFYAGSRYQAGRLLTDSDTAVLQPAGGSTVEDRTPPSAPSNTPTPVDREPNINSFEDCVAAGNPVMESYPRQCRSEGGKHFVEEIDEEPQPPGDQSAVMMCSAESRKAEACTQVYQPVCAAVEVQCITTPCNPVPQTYGNACEACMNQNTLSYTAGECSLDNV